MCDDLVLRLAGTADLTWLVELLNADAVAPFLSTGALDELGAALEAAALRAFDAAGFRREGVRRRAYDRHAAWQDGVLFGLLADD